MGNNEIATQDDVHTDISVLPPRQPMQATARQVLMDHAELASMAYEFATKLVGTKMVPLRFRNAPEEATAAILYGAELGLGPISALQNIFEVHGSPGIYARTAQALLEARGFHFKTVEHTNEACAVYGWYPHHNPEVDEVDEESRFTIEDAQLAGWAPRELDSDKGGVLIRGVRYEANSYGKLDGNEQYITKPRQMLWAKSMMETCRHLSPATLLGIAYSVEELESEHASHNPIGGSSSGAASNSDALTVEEILSAATGNSTPPPYIDPSKIKAPIPEANIASASGSGPERSAEDSHGNVKVADDGMAEAWNEVPEPEPEPEPVKNKRQSKREQSAAAKAGKDAGEAIAGQIDGKPKGHTTRVEAALAKAKAKQDGTAEPEGTETPETTPASEPEPQAAPVETPEPSEPTGDPSEPDPGDDAEALTEAAEQRRIDEAYEADLAAAERANTAVLEAARGSGQQPAAATAQDLGDDPDGDMDEQASIAAAQRVPTPEPVKAPQNWDGAKPATREQLQELAGCIAAAGFKPTAAGKAEWFAWLSQEVEREVTSNNQLARKEITRVIESMKADQD